MNINITKITIIHNPHGMDSVSLQTDLPPTTPPEVSDEDCDMTFRCTKNTGEAYCKQNFPGVPIQLGEI